MDCRADVINRQACIFLQKFQDTAVYFVYAGVHFVDFISSYLHLTGKIGTSFDLLRLKLCQ